MRKWTMCVLSVCVLGVGIQGCKPRQSKAEREALLQQEVAARFEEITGLQAQGQPDGAMALLEKCLANAKYKAYRPRFFMQKVDLLLAQAKGAEAEKVVLAAWEKEPQLARSVFGRIHAYHQDGRDNAALLAWCGRLLGVGKGSALPKDLLPKVLEWQLAAATALEDGAAVAGAIDQMITRLEPKVAAPLLQQAISALTTAGKFAQASEMIEHIAAKEGAAVAYKDLAVTARLKNLLAQKNWAGVVDAVAACVAQLADDALLKQLNQTFTVLQKEKQVALIEQISEGVFRAAAFKEKSAGYAARLWVDIGVAANKSVLPQRLVALLDAKVQAEQVAMLLERHFYALAKDTAAIKNLFAICERIIRECKDQETIDALKIKRLEGAFITEDYDLAIEMLEQGIPDKPPQWHEMSIPKVKAHRALAQDKPLEAIDHFRAFMKALAESDQEEEHDPVTGVANSREWILARNAHRIATLYDAASDPANAAKAREEAKALFAAALIKAEKDDDALKQLKAEMREMGF